MWCSDVAGGYFCFESRRLLKPAVLVEKGMMLADEKKLEVLYMVSTNFSGRWPDARLRELVLFCSCFVIRA